MNGFEKTREMNLQTISLTEQRGIVTIQINRPGAHNSINALLLSEIIRVLRVTEEDSDVKVIVLMGNTQCFCTGMDFNELTNNPDAWTSGDPNQYYDVMKSFSNSSKIIISKVEGKVNAGGIGLVAASDIVIAGEDATFGLSEALFGLLPACVLPFLIRRVGYQKSLWMTLTTQAISAKRAHEIGLADEVAQDVNDALRRTLLRLTRLSSQTVRELKNYMENLWIINEETKSLAVTKLSTLISSDVVRFNIKNFTENKKFPWDKQ